MAEGHQTHVYYQMPLVPVICIYAGTGMNYLWGKDLFKDSFLKNRLTTKSALTILFILITVISVLRSKHFLSYNSERLAYGKRIEQLTDKDSLIIFGGWNKGDHLQVKYHTLGSLFSLLARQKAFQTSFNHIQCRPQADLSSFRDSRE